MIFRSKHIAEKIEPERTLFIDDREGNLNTAKELGFNVKYYLLTDESRTLMDVVKEGLVV